MTLLETFERSSLGAFTRSPLGARNRPARAWHRQVLVFMFIDEARGGIEGETDIGYVDGNGNDTEGLTAVFDNHVTNYIGFRNGSFNTTNRQLLTTVMHVKQLQPAPGLFLPIVPASRVGTTFITPRNPGNPFVRHNINNRPPTLERLNEIFDETLTLLPGGSQISVLLLVDGSGSMNGGDVLQPTLGEFARSLEARGNIRLQALEITGGEGSDTEFFDEQWVKFVMEQVQERLLR